jgi:hypothetical protein
MRIFIALSIVALLAMPVAATVYTDATGENFTNAGGGILDIVSVEVTNTATDITFKLTLNGDTSSPNDWGKYMIGIDTVPGGDPAGDGWARPIGMTTGSDRGLTREMALSFGSTPAPGDCRTRLMAPIQMP